MKVAVSAVALLLVPGTITAQEAKFNFDGVFDLGSTNSKTATRYNSAPAGETESTGLSWGFDLSLKTYLIDPRFITITFEPSIHRGTGRTDALGNRDSDTGGSFYLDFLKTSYYPLRLYFIDHSLGYEQEHLSSASVARRSLGFDWTLRKPKLPPLFISYDTSRFGYEFSLTPATVTHASNFLATTQGKYASWTTNVAYSRQASTQAFTGVTTSTDLIRGSASRGLWAHSQLSTNVTFEHLRLTNEPGTGAMDLPFLSVHTDLRTRHTKKLTTVFSHQYYRTGTPAPAVVAPAPTTVGDGTAPPVAPTFEFGTASFNDIRGQVAYQVSSSLTARVSGDTSVVDTPAHFETVARNASFSGGLNWIHRINFMQTRAGFEEGVAYADSTLGNSRSVPFWNADLGVSAGEPQTLLVSTDSTYSHRPDLFEIGGYYSLWQTSASLDSEALRGFRIRASGAMTQIRFLTQRGYERFHTMNYSVSITRSIFSLALARSADISLRNLLFESAIAPAQFFITLPVQTLLNSPFSGSNGVYTTGAFSVRPGRRFEVDARYLRQRNLFTNGPSVLLRQYELYGTYRLGKFLVTAGLLYLGDTTDDQLHHLRRYYFFRVSRPFRIL